MSYSQRDAGGSRPEPPKPGFEPSQQLRLTLFGLALLMMAVILNVTSISSAQPVGFLDGGRVDVAHSRLSDTRSCRMNSA